MIVNQLYDVMDKELNMHLERMSRNGLREEEIYYSTLQ